tara:strand:- start:3816 stop:4247 length:432 start_codon:yes stop_codon:yes gene_type:complete
MKEELIAAEEKKSWKWRTTLSFALAGVFVIVIVAASWAPESQMTKIKWIPGWIAELADREPNIRTAIPFIPLAFFLFLGLSTRSKKHPLVSTVMICAFCLCLAELGQNLLPDRTTDVKDLIWGAAGILVGIVLAKLSPRNSNI